MGKGEGLPQSEKGQSLIISPALRYRIKPDNMKSDVKNIKAIVHRKKANIDCTEDESAELKGFIRDCMFKDDGVHGDCPLLLEVIKLFCIEYGEVCDEPNDKWEEAIRKIDAKIKGEEVPTEKVRMVLMSHLSDIQTGLLPNAILIDEVNFVKFLIRKFPNTDMHIDPDKEYKEYADFMANR
jgi:hypothetical protein